MNAIDKLIFDHLASGRGLNLPDVGALSVKREPAGFTSHSQIRPPYNKVVFSPKREEGFDSVIDLIMADEDVKRPDATQKYKEWLAQAKQEKGLIEIAGVGVLRDEFFYPSALLIDTLNPAGDEPVELKRRTGRNRLAVIISLCLLGVALAVATIFLFPELEGRLCNRSGDKEASETESELVWQEDGSGAEIEDIESTEIEDNAPASGTEEQSVEDLIQQSLEQQAQSATTQEQGTPSSVATVSDSYSASTTASATTTASPSKTVYYIVAGVFTDEANADKLIAADTFKLGREAYTKMPYKGKTMVTIYSSTSREAAYNRQTQLLYLNPDLWIHERD